MWCTALYVFLLSPFILILQEEDLTVLRDRWSKALARRKQYLDEQIQRLINKPGEFDDCKKDDFIFIA